MHRLLFVALLTSTAAHAVNSNHFGPGRAGPSLFSLDLPELLPAGGYAARTTYSIAHQPLVCVAPRERATDPHIAVTGTEPDRRAPAVQNAHLASLALAYSPVDVLEVSVGLPLLALDARYGPTNLVCPRAGGATGFLLGWNDPEARLRWRVLDVGPLVISLRGGLRAPLAWLMEADLESGLLFGDRSMNGFLGATLGVRHRRLRGVLDVGMVLRPGPRPELLHVHEDVSVTVQDEVTFGAGLQADLVWGFSGTVEVSGRYIEALADPTGERETHVPLEVIGGLKYDVGGLQVTLGAGAGLSTGYGTPRTRVLTSVAYTGGGLFPLDWLRSLPDLTPDIDLDLPGLEDALGKLRATPTPRERPHPPPSPSEEAPCPDPGSPEARLVLVPGCPPPIDDAAPTDDAAEDGAVDDVLDDTADHERRPAPAGEGTSAERELVVVLHLTFAHDVATLAAGEHERLLRELRAVPVGGELVGVTVRAHADASGADAYNDALSARRAAHVTVLLEKAGVPRAIIEVEARGARDPLLGDELHGANRRVRVALHYRLSPGAP